MVSACNKGTPAFVIVASWRANIAISKGFILLVQPITGLDLRRIRLSTMPCLRSCALAIGRLLLLSSPVILCP